MEIVAVAHTTSRPARIIAGREVSGSLLRCARALERTLRLPGRTTKVSFRVVWGRSGWMRHTGRALVLLQR